MSKDKMKGLGGKRTPRRPSGFFTKSLAPLPDDEVLEELDEPPHEEEPQKEVATPQKKKPKRRTRKPRDRRGRVEFKIDSKRERVLERLIVKLRKQSGQRDASASEFICGALDLLGNIEGHIDFKSVPGRGAWGSEDAETFKLQIGQSLLNGIETWVFDESNTPDISVNPKTADLDQDLEEKDVVNA